MHKHDEHTHDDTCGDDCGHDHDHQHSPVDELITVRDLVRYATSRFNRKKIFCGHGLQDVYDEAVYLVLHTLHLPLDRLDPFLDACIPADERSEVIDIIHRRSDERIPAAYLTREAWLGQFRFYVDERVIVPRSFCAELLEGGLAPWIPDDEAVTDALDLCTGSGCLAILMAHRYTNAQIDAIDLSPEALEVASINVEDYGLQGRIQLIESDVFNALVGEERYDLIISNPPYVTQESVDNLPEEYRHEPAMSLGAGSDGMDIVRRIIAQAGQYLKPDGILIIEVGHNRAEFEEAFPALEAVWLSQSSQEEMVLLLRADQL
jgi:ribosomal protein L3 glutamine methyltransferase